MSTGTTTRSGESSSASRSTVPQDGGSGAWELAARADYIDLNDEGVKGGEQISYIGGVNWYANDYVRFMLDGAVTQVFDAGNSAAAADGSSNLIYGAGMRAQVDW